MLGARTPAKSRDPPGKAPATDAKKRSTTRSKEDDFERLQKLGAGSFGVVYTVRRKQDSKLYVLK